MRTTLTRRLRGSADAPFPVTSLDALLDCPFLAFAERVLGSKRETATDDDGGARDAGTLAHAALCAVANDPVAAAERDAQKLAARATDVAREIIAPERATSTLQRLRRARLVDQVVALVVADREEMIATGRRFVGAEVSFGEREGGWPALVVGANANAVSVQGRIDRWDVVVDARGRTNAIVVDYKASLPDGTTIEAFFTGKGSVQLAVYARAVAANCGASRVARVDGRYFAYRRASLGKPVGHARGDDAVWRAQVGDAAEGEGEGDVAGRIVESFAAIRSGLVPARRGPRCESCAQRAACRAPDVVLEAGGE
jgi:ATP-dependent helicase/DNAse subunit B